MGIAAGASGTRVGANGVGAGSTGAISEAASWIRCGPSTAATGAARRGSLGR
jgi:hypothetical protein